MSKFLVGKTINAIKIADDKCAILFICDDGNHAAILDSECPKNSWVENIEMTGIELPAIVNDTLELDIIDFSEIPNWDGVIYYGFKIKTNKGYILIDYRNNSGGYCGSQLYWPNNEYFYGDSIYSFGRKFAKDPAEINWVDIERKICN